MVKDFLIQIILSAVLILVAAFVVLKISPSNNTVGIIILVIYAISCFVGGILIGKTMETRKFLWGLASGALYIGAILLISFLVSDNSPDGMVSSVTSLIVCLSSGTIGGMIS